MNIQYYGGTLFGSQLEMFDYKMHGQAYWINIIHQ